MFYIELRQMCSKFCYFQKYVFYLNAIFNMINKILCLCDLLFFFLFLYWSIICYICSMYVYMS